MLATCSRTASSLLRRLAVRTSLRPSAPPRFIRPFGQQPADGGLDFTIPYSTITPELLPLIISMRQGITAEELAALSEPERRGREETLKVLHAGAAIRNDAKRAEYFARKEKEEQDRRAGRALPTEKKWTPASSSSSSALTTIDFAAIPDALLPEIIASRSRAPKFHLSNFDRVRADRILTILRHGASMTSSEREAYFASMNKKTFDLGTSQAWSPLPAQQRRDTNAAGHGQRSLDPGPSQAAQSPPPAQRRGVLAAGQGQPEQGPDKGRGKAVQQVESGEMAEEDALRWEERNEKMLLSLKERDERLEKEVKSGVMSEKERERLVEKMKKNDGWRTHLAIERRKYIVEKMKEEGREMTGHIRRLLPPWLRPPPATTTGATRSSSRSSPPSATTSSSSTSRPTSPPKSLSSSSSSFTPSSPTTTTTPSSPPPKAPPLAHDPTLTPSARTLSDVLSGRYTSQDSLPWADFERDQDQRLAEKIASVRAKVAQGGQEMTEHRSQKVIEKLESQADKWKGRARERREMIEVLRRKWEEGKGLQGGEKEEGEGEGDREGVQGEEGGEKEEGEGEGEEVRGADGEKKEERTKKEKGEGDA